MLIKKEKKFEITLQLQGVVSCRSMSKGRAAVAVQCTSDRELS